MKSLIGAVAGAITLAIVGFFLGSIGGAWLEGRNAAAQMAAIQSQIQIPNPFLAGPPPTLPRTKVDSSAVDLGAAIDGSAMIRATALAGSPPTGPVGVTWLATAALALLGGLAGWMQGRRMDGPRLPGARIKAPPLPR